MPTPLFPRDRLNQFALGAGFWGERSITGVETAERLLSRRADGTLQALSETRAEQSFNERLFSELFGYQTLLRSGKGAYHLRPKHWHTGGRYDDFSLGFFGPTGGTPLVSCELKSPEADLDAPQSGEYQGVTPVQQAMRAVAQTPSVKWVLLSNFDEIRLYRAGNTQRFHSIWLSELLTPWDVEKALAVFSRETLLGDQGRLAPIERLLRGEVPNMLEPRDGCVRLVHRLRPLEPLTTELRVHVLHDALTAGFKQYRGVWSIIEPSPVLEEDRLVVRVPGTRGVSLIVELTTSGVLALSHYFDGVERGPRQVEASAVTERIARFLQFANVITQALKVADFQATWSLLDVADSSCSVPKGWASPPGYFEFTMTKGVKETRVPPTLFSKEKPASLVQMTREAVREILYPYEGRSPHVGISSSPESLIIARICPSDEQVRALLAESGIRER